MKSLQQFFKLTIIAIAFCVPLKLFAIEHVTMTIDSATSTANTLEFTVKIVNDGTTTLDLGGYQFGVNFSNTILNGAVPGSTSFIYIPGSRDPMFNALSNTSTTYSNNQLKVTCVPSIYVNIPAGIAFKLGRFRFTTPTSWLPSSTPNLQFQLLQAPGKTNCLAYCYVNSNPPPGTSLTFALTTLNGVSNVGGFLLNVPLPVTLSHFSGEQQGATDVLKWGTSQELNNAFFEVQHSTDGFNYKQIAQIASKGQIGNSQSALEYEFKYPYPVIGNNYYRLVQVDIDGHSTVETKTVILSRYADANVFQIYPNPMKDIMHLKIESLKAQKFDISLISLQGSVVRMLACKTQIGTNNINLNVADLSVGTYLLQISENGKMIYTNKLNKVQ